jgi:hypothetical protein
MEKQLNDKVLERMIESVRQHRSDMENLEEDLGSFSSYFRKLYYSTNRISFKAWCEVVEGLLDELN